MRDPPGQETALPHGPSELFRTAKFLASTASSFVKTWIEASTHLAAGIEKPAATSPRDSAGPLDDQVSRRLPTADRLPPEPAAPHPHGKKFVDSESCSGCHNGLHHRCAACFPTQEPRLRRPHRCIQWLPGKEIKAWPLESRHGREYCKGYGYQRTLIF